MVESVESVELVELVELSIFKILFANVIFFS